MRIIAKKSLVAIYARYRDSKTALEDWYEKTEEARWENFSDVRRTFNSADLVGNRRIVFNIKGNKYRLVALVLFRVQMVYIRFVGTHTDYAAIDNIQEI
ncbi:MAG: type II toxin-antitoxin system HigB family toxin [Bacteroidales bacterium]|nr:type II toxin-antitoxin system HigB family toxin [Bacteroidales bacterium]